MKLQSEAKTIVHARNPPYSPMRARGADSFERSLYGPERSHTLTRVKPVLGRDAPFGGLRQIPKSITLACRRHCRFTSDLSPRAAARARKELQTIVNMPGSISSALSARWFYETGHQFQPQSTLRTCRAATATTNATIATPA